MGFRDRHTRHLAAGLVAGALAVSACGSSATSSSSASSTTATSAASTSAGSAPAGSVTTTTAATSAGSATTAGSAATAGSGTISGPGVTATTITIGQIASVTGPVAGLFQDADDAMDGYVAYINSLGGLDGHKLIVVHKDDAYNCDEYTNDLKTLSKQVFAVVGTFSAQDGCGDAVLKADPTLPNIEADILNPELYALPSSFAPDPQPPGYPTTGYQWIKAKFPNDIAHTADLYSVESEFAFKEQSLAAESVGYKYVYSRGLGLTETNFTSDVLRMKADGIKIVDLSGVAAQTVAEFEQAANQQNFHPDAVIAPVAYDKKLFTLLGNPALAANVYAPLLQALFLGQDRANNPELNIFLTWLDKTHPGASADLFGTDAWAAGVLFTQGVRQAGSNVTQSSLVQALNATTSFSANGLLPTADPAKRQGAFCMVIAGVQNGGFVRIDPATTGFECNGSYDNIPVSKLT